MALLNPVAPVQKPRTFSSFLIALSLGIALLYFGRVFFVTLIISIILAFILEPAVRGFMRMRVPRGLASFFVCAIALLLLYLMGLGLYTQFSGLVEDLPSYSQRINELIDSASAKLDQMERSTYDLLVPKRLRDREAQIQQPVEQSRANRKKRSAEPPMPPPVQEVRIRQDRPTLLQTAYDSIRSFYEVLLMASFVPFLVYFMLSWSDHLRRAYLQLFNGPARQVAAKTWEGIAAMARAYVVGNFILGLFLSVVSSAFFYFMKLPYWILVGPASGFLSLIPYIGLPLAIAPPVLAALPAYHSVTEYVVLATAVAFLHLLALNLLYPKVVGARVHLNPLVVTIALMFWATLWGGIGLIVAIPITAGIKAVFDNVAGLQPFGKLLGD
jgi:predicted PurR-regulated permease PerM